jgi:23S rRNA (uracil1939-C5)-methyltransferase
LKIKFIKVFKRLFLRYGKKNTDKVVFHQIKVLDAGAKGVSVAKAPDGKVIFIPNVVPAIVDTDIQKEKPITKVKP